MNNFYRLFHQSIYMRKVSYGGNMDMMMKWTPQGLGINTNDKINLMYKMGSHKIPLDRAKERRWKHRELAKQKGAKF